MNKSNIKEVCLCVPLFLLVFVKVNAQKILCQSKCKDLCIYFENYFDKKKSKKLKKSVDIPNYIC